MLASTRETVPRAGSPSAAPDVPPALAASPLLRRGGFTVTSGLTDAELVRRLRAEAFARFAGATLNRAARPDGEVWRGGCPERRYRSSAAGAVQDAFYHAPWVIDFLSRQVGLQVAPTGARGSYSYYRPGDFLGLHRDVEACDLAVITCLYHGPEAHPEGGLLALYPERTREPLPAIRKAPEEGRRTLRLAPGRTLLLLGGIVPHQVVPTGAGEVRVVSVLCYRARVS